MIDVCEGKHMKLNTRLIKLEELPNQIDTMEAQCSQYEQKSVKLLENTTAGHLENIL